MSDNDTIYQYRVYCIEEGKNVTVWSKTKPTLCPNDHTDRSIDPIRTTVIDTISKQHVITDDGLQGNYQVINIEYDIPSGASGDVTIHDRSWPMDLEVWRSYFKPQSQHIGDKVDFITAPDTLIGALTATGISGSTGLTVTSITTDLETGIVKGHEITITDTITPTHLGRIIGIDRENYQLIMELPLPQDYPIGSAIILQPYMVKDYTIIDTEKIVLGEKGFKATILPANTIVRLIYTNHDGNAKKIYVHTEYYYS